MKKRLAELLKFISIAALPLVLYPVYLLLLGLFGETDGPKAILSYFSAALPLGVLSFLCYYAAYRFTLKLSKHPYLITLLKILCVILCIAFSTAAGLLLPYSSLALRIVLIIPFFLLCMWIGSAASRRYDDILYDRTFLIGCLSYLVCYIAEFFVQVNNFASFTDYGTIPLLLTFIGISAIVLNQANIDDLMNRRRFDFHDLPAKIRYRNLILILCVYALFLVIYIFRQPLVSLVSAAGSFILDLLLIGLRVFAFLTQIDPDVGGTAEGPENDWDMGDGIHGTEQPTNHLELICIIVCIILFVLLMIFKGKDIAAFFVNKFRAFGAWLKKVFRGKRKEKLRQEDLNGFYVDDVEDIVPVTKKENKEDEIQIKNGKKFGKVLKQLDKIEDPTKKIRMSYKALIQYIKFKGIEVRTSDTARQIDRKTEAELYHSDFDMATDVYETVRYAERLPNEQQLSVMDQSVRTILKEK